MTKNLALTPNTMNVSNNDCQPGDQGYKTLGDRQRVDKTLALYAW